ncbi:MAG: glycosyltransferase [Candidatus Binatia bacterium]
MRILHVGHPAVVPALRRLGHEVVAAAEVAPEVVVAGRPFDLGALWRRLTPAADLLFVADALGRQPLGVGVETITAPRLYWAIDVHLNFFWQRHYAHLFDLTLVAQRDYVPFFAADGIPARWLPWGVDETVFRDLGIARTHAVSFVGLVDPVTRPKRTAIIERLRRRMAIATFGETLARRLPPGDVAWVLSQTAVALNECILGDLNFRVFEAMACGAMLLTEHIGNGLTDLFTPGVHLDVFGPDDLEAKADHYVRHAAERARIAASGSDEVHRRHTMTHRMADVVALVADGIPRRDTRQDAALHLGLAAHGMAVRGLVDPEPACRVAIERLRPALLEDGRAEAGLAVGEMLAWVGRDEGALTILGASRRIDPGDLRAWLLASRIALRRGDSVTATRLAHEGLASARHVSSATRAAAEAALPAGIDHPACLHALGVALREAGHPFTAGLVRQVGADLPATALEYHTRAFEQDPRLAAAATEAGAVLEAAGLPEFAVQFDAAAARLAPEDHAIRDALARTLARSYRGPAAVAGAATRPALVS